MLHDWKRFIYTDGSVVDTGTPGIGAAVHVPDTADSIGNTIRVDCLLESDPPYSQNVNTIARAELSAIRVALTTAADHTAATTADQSTHIATDSLASMYAIQKMISRPQDLQEHRHLHILQEITSAIASSRGTVHIWKVKSHTGIIGNELADQAAVATAHGEPIPEEETHHTHTVAFNTPSNHRLHLYWPYEIRMKPADE